MLKRIKETLTCNSSGGRSRTIRQFKLHLLHGDKNTYFYKSNGKVKNILYSSKISTIPLVLSVFGLLLVLELVMCPICKQTHAVSDEGSNSVSNADTILSLRFGDTTLSKDVEAGKPGFQATDMYVTATNIDSSVGYSLSVQTTSSSATLLSAADVTKSVSSINPNLVVQGAEMPSNTWGYALEEGLILNNVVDESNIQDRLSELKYKAVGTSASPKVDRIYTDGDANDKPFTLAFGANIAAGMPAGSYKTNILVSLAAGTGEVVSGIGFAGKTYMQEVNKTFCDSIPANVDGSVVQGQLMDSRDSNIYWVAKLADGLCWMTQNLDYGTSHYDPGLKILDGVNLVSVEDSSVYVMSTDEEMLAVTKPDQYNPGKLYYNAHYLVGNYYTWQQASLGTAGTVSGLAPDSICPEGWGLPIGNQAIGLSSSLGSTGRLLATYDISESSGAFKLQEYPMFFLRTGYGNNMIGTYGYYWTASTYYGNTGNYAYILRFNANSVTAPNEVQGIGASSTYMPVRCVAR